MTTRQLIHRFFSVSFGLTAAGILATEPVLPPAPTTTWEEGARAAGIYKDGDALEDIPGFGVDAGFSVAMTDNLLAYGRKGRIGVFTRKKDGTHESRAKELGKVTLPLQLKLIRADAAN